MKAGKLITMACIAAVALTQAPPASAHRLDEYLQATRIAVEPDRVDIEIDLTPGADVAANVIASIDANHDGEISVAEQEAYARVVLDAVSLEVDDRPRRLAFVAMSFPSIPEMKEGLGVIRVHASAETPVSAGSHRLFYRNEHRPEKSVYLANAMVPASDAVRIAQQNRDTLQHELRFDYSLSPKTGAGWPSPLWLLISVGGVGAFILKFRTRWSGKKVWTSATAVGS